MPPAPGSRVHVAMTKWGERPHWEYDAVLLGSDAHGDWVGVPADTAFSRPGRHLVVPVPHVVLAPSAGSGGWWVATFHDHLRSWGPGRTPVAVYVDIATPPAWDGTALRAVDLDLDVVRDTSGRVWVDDEDEFAQHRVELGYPDEVARAATASCDRVRAAVEGRRAPYDGETHLRWLELAREL